MTQITVRGDLAAGIIAACVATGIATPSASQMGTGSLTPVSTTLTWTPDLSAQDQATLASVVKLAVGATLLTKAERDALEGDINTLRLYDNASSPTNAQTVTAVKSIIHVLRALVRD